MRFLVAVLFAGFAASTSLVDLPVHKEALKKALEAPESFDDKGDQTSQREDEEEVKDPSLRRLKSLTQRCPAAIDIVVNQDTTGSMSSRHMNKIKRKLESAFQAVEFTYPGSRFGLTQFEDIPKFPFGRSDDTCYERFHALGSDISAFISSFNSLDLGGGKDYPESQYTALMASALDTMIGFRGDTDSGTRVAKVVLTITDAIPHVEGDGKIFGLGTNPGTFPPNCGRDDYPSFDQVVNALENRKAIPAFFVRERNSIFYPNPVPVYEEFVEVVMENHGSVTSTDSFNRIGDKILDAIDLAMEQWCDKYPEEPTTPEITEDEDCLTRDVLFVRDLSSSTMGHIGNMKEFLEGYVDASPPGSTFGLVSHSDKPVQLFGYPISMDYCYWRHTDLTTKDEFIAAYEDADSDYRSGGDFPENQLDATIRGVSDVTWTQENSNCNCVVLLTDAFYHEAGDFASGTVYDPATDLCETSDYPSVQQVADALAENKIGCVTVATMDVVTEFWDKFETDLIAAGYPGTFTIEVISEPTLRKLSASFATQPKSDLRHLKSYLSSSKQQKEQIV